MQVINQPENTLSCRYHLPQRRIRVSAGRANVLLRCACLGFLVSVRHLYHTFANTINDAYTLLSSCKCHLRGLIVLSVCFIAAPSLVWAQLLQYAGQVTIGGVPVPGASVTATQGDQRKTTVTDDRGIYRIDDLREGPCQIRVEMLGFEPAIVDVVVSPTTAATPIALTLRPIEAAPTPAPPTPTTPAPTTTARTAPATTPATPDRPKQTPDHPKQAEQRPRDGDSNGNGEGNAPADAADGLLINGSVNNASASHYAQASAFGNNRPGTRALYTGTFEAIGGNSAWDARPYAFAGQQAPKPDFNNLQLVGTLGGPLRLPHAPHDGATFFVGYRRRADHTATTQSALVPTALERRGDFSQSRDGAGRPVSIVDPVTGAPFAGNVIPSDRLSPEALSLLAFYPQPNVADNRGFNYQAPLLSTLRTDEVQSRVTQNLGTKNQLSATVAWSRAATDSSSLFDFTDKERVDKLDVVGMWVRQIRRNFALKTRVEVTRNASSLSPFFAGRDNVSGLAGIVGNDQRPENWGPPSLAFSSGVLGLMDAAYDDTTVNSQWWSVESLWAVRRHTLTAGVGVHFNDVTSFGQKNARGSFTFTGSASGSDLADFLLGRPQAAAVAFGDPDKRLRGNAYEAYFSDEWRVSTGTTITAGVRWELEEPMREARGRLTNLDVVPGFTAVSPVVPGGGDGATGPLTGQRFPDTLLHTDWRGIQPRVGISWRPLAGSSLVFRGGYGIYRNTSTYQAIDLLLAQQPPFSKAFAIATSAANPLALATALAVTPVGAPAVTFAVDPNFRVGSLQNWQLMVQRDLPLSMTFSASYLGARGDHLMQESLPNTYPAGAENPCPTCPAGFVFLSSHGESTRHAGQFQLRRRLRNGLSASLQYTLSKSRDNASALSGLDLTGVAIAQDWRNLDAEWGPSSFDQRHLLTVQMSYTTGMGNVVETGRRAALMNGWTITSQVTAGSGLPLTPIFLTSVAGTGVTGTLRPSLTGAPLTAGSGLYANPAAYTAPAPGTFGNAGRNSITGPANVVVMAGIMRNFPIRDRISLDWHVDVTNLLNQVNYTAVNTIVGSPQFGLPTTAGSMRTIVTTFLLHF